MRIPWKGRYIFILVPIFKGDYYYNLRSKKYMEFEPLGGIALDSMRSEEIWRWEWSQLSNILKKKLLKTFNREVKNWSHGSLEWDNPFSGYPMKMILINVMDLRESSWPCIYYRNSIFQEEYNPYKLLMTMD